MSRVECRILDNGTTFPEIKFSTVEGSAMVLPRDFGERWNVLLLYRGHW